MGDSRSGLNVPLVALQATEHLEGKKSILACQHKHRCLRVPSL